MFGWLRRDKPPPLTGARAVRREKTYSAESGYAYRYYYCGQRLTGRGMEYVWEAGADRHTVVPVSVFLSEAALASWQSAHQRELTGPERYAVAKMSLLRAFDLRPNPAAMREEVIVRPDDVASILDTLGLE
jgi:hypothetical protein